MMSSPIAITGTTCYRLIFKVVKQPETGIRQGRIPAADVTYVRCRLSLSCETKNAFDISEQNRNVRPHFLADCKRVVWTAKSHCEDAATACKQIIMYLSSTSSRSPKKWNEGYSGKADRVRT